MVQHAKLTVAVAARDLAAMGIDGAEGKLVPVAGTIDAVQRRAHGPPTLLLSGNLGYRPTVDGTRWFARKVWPRLHQRHPELRWLVVGARPAQSVLGLQALDNVEVHPDVDSLAPYFARATLAIAPMRSGSGVPMKVLEAWASDLPVITTPWAADGLETGDAPALVVADSAEEWVLGVAKILDDPPFASALASAGREVYDRVYRPDRVQGCTVEAAELAMAN
jgi:hypothetical protein